MGLLALPGLSSVKQTESPYLHLDLTLLLKGSKAKKEDLMIWRIAPFKTTPYSRAERFKAAHPNNQILMNAGVIPAMTSTFLND
jgi:hypothetical protein